MIRKKPSPLTKANAKDAKRIYKRADAMTKHIKMRLSQGYSADDAVYSAMSRYKWWESLEETAATAAMEGAKIGAATSGVASSFASVGFTREVWLNRTFNGATLSERITTASAEGAEQVVSAIRQSMIEAKSWSSTAKAAERTGQIYSDPTALLGELRDASRRALKGDASDIAKYEKALARFQAHTDRLLMDEGSPRGALRRAYQRVIDATENGSQVAIDRAVERAVQKKMAYNAQRIVRTERANAYGASIRNGFIADPDVVGMRYILSSSHAIEDICDLYTGADLYGMGAGGYPLEHGPDYPFHPNCQCQIEPIFRDEATGKETFDPSAGGKWLDSQSDRMRQGVLGVTGSETWSEGGDWQNIARGYGGMKKQGYYTAE